MINKSELVELCRRYQKGDNSAYEELYRVLYYPVYRYAFGLSRNKSDSEDLTHDAFMKLAKNISSFKNNNVLAWLFTVVRNAFFDAKRKTRKISESEDSDFQIESASAKKDVDPVLEIKSEDILKDLTPEERELLVLKYWEEYDMKEIARIVGKTHDAVRKEISRLIIRLRKKHKRINNQ